MILREVKSFSELEGLDMAFGARFFPPSCCTFSNPAFLGGRGSDLDQAPAMSQVPHILYVIESLQWPNEAELITPIL